MATYKLLLLPGDGIGPEVMAEVKRLLAFLAKAGIATFETEEGMVVDMPRPGLRHRPQSPGTTEGNALGAGRDFIAALRRAGLRVEPVERAPAPIAARDP